MSFYYPLGLLGLIGIPILIILYIIRSRYTEKTVPSVYLWNLSEKFLKKRRRLNIFNGLFALIMQILAVAAISLAIAHPSFTLKDSARDYCFILDASGSMRTERNGETRFDAGKSKIADIIGDAGDGSTFTLVLSSQSATVVFEKLGDREQALNSLSAVECGWLDSDCTDAVSVVREYYTEDSSPTSYLVTDKAYETENINLIDVSDGEDNYAFVEYDYHSSVSSVAVKGKVISHASDAELTVELYADGVKMSDLLVDASAGAPTDFEFTADVKQFGELKLVITNPDGLPQDNIGILYGEDAEQHNRALVVSDSPAYIEFALRASGKTAVDTVTTSAYASGDYTGYGLYVFDTFSDSSKLPQELPDNAALWFFNVRQSIPHTGFSYREVRAADGEEYFEPTYTSLPTAFAKSLTDNLVRLPVAVKKYQRYVPSPGFTPVMQCNRDDLIFVGTNENGNRQVVFAFALEDTNFAMKPDFLILTDNLLSYSFPSAVEDKLYSAGDEMIINVPSGCSDLVLVSPSGKTSYPDFSSAYTTAVLDEVGSYSLTVTENGVSKSYSVYSAMPKSESYDITGGEIAITELTDKRTTDGFYDSLVVFFVVLAVAFLLDWGVYCYGQYQLR